MGKALGLRLQEALDVRGFTQGQLELKAGVTQQHISMIITGERKSPGIEKLAAIARALDVSLDWLAFGRTRDPAVLTPDEDELLRAYRTLREAGRGGSVLAGAKAALEELEGTNRS